MRINQLLVVHGQRDSVTLYFDICSNVITIPLPFFLKDFGHILSRKATWSMKNQKVKVVIEHWPAGKSEGLWEKLHCRANRRVAAKYFELHFASVASVSRGGR